MPIKRVVPSGYCQGVVAAIKKVKETVENNPNTKIYVLGAIVHNEYILKAFDQLVVITLSSKTKTKLELLDEIEEGIVIFTAHGISDEVKNKAINKGLQVVDASCKYVLKNKALIEQFIEEGYSVIYIGKENHPESEAAISISDKVYLVTDETSLNNLNLNTDKIIVTNQTTMSIKEISSLIDSIKTKFPTALVFDEICSATRRRQEAVLALKDTDILIVVGDPSSNNTAQLANVGKLIGIKEVYKVETANDLDQYQINTNKNISVTAGASTPKCLSDNVINYLESKDNKYKEVDLKQILDI